MARRIGTPTGKIVETTLDEWRVAYLFFWYFQNGGFGEQKPIEAMLQLPPDDSFFSSVVARTFRYGWDAGFANAIENM